MFPSIVVSGGVHSKNLRKGDGECLRASVAISTLSTSEGRGKKQGGHASVNNGNYVGFPISFNSNCASLAMQNDGNYCQYYLYNVSNTGFNYGGSASYTHWISFLAFGL